ncbi:MAG: beta-glucosidase BglX [Bacteroidetes bacterium]|nr:beta-glucosidase BglX [Bacteroidota bacterium]
MKKILFICFSLLLSGAVLAQDAKMEAFVSDLMSKMTLEEKIGQLNLVTFGEIQTGAVVSSGVDAKIRKGQVGGLFGSSSFKDIKGAQTLAVTNSRLKIPLLFGLDVIHGLKTTFPVPLGLASSWDLELIEKTARAAAAEASAVGVNWTFSPMVDIARDPRWGRIAEGNGEDPYLGSLIAGAMVKGYQGKDLAAPNTILACVKHYALYGAAEAGRDYNTVDMSRVQMHEFYLPPYRAAVEAGVATVMSSFNEVDGIPATGSHYLMTDLLRSTWGFKGFVVTDYTAINEMTMHGAGNLQEVSAKALKAGIDQDMVGEGFLTTLEKSLKEGKVSLSDIETACRRILEAKYKLGLFEDPFRYLDEKREKSEILSPENRKLAREAGARSMVLLKNEKQLLPLKKSGTIALVGPLADNLKDPMGTWFVAGDWNSAVTVRKGFENVLGNSVRVNYALGANISEDPMLLAQLDLTHTYVKKNPADLIAEAVDAAKKSDVVVAVLGESEAMSGEAASRSDIGIPENQKDLLKALVNTGKPVVLVLMNGRPLTLTWEAEHVPAILEAWAPGIEAGHAVADVLFGDYNPSGKITATFPRNVGQIPLYYNHKNTGRPYDGNLKDKYKSKYLDVVNEPLYPFGYGLSYTTFEYSDLKLSTSAPKGLTSVTASVTVKNTGKFAGGETVQLYISDPVASVNQPVKKLKGFEKIFLKPGESKEVRFTITPEQLKFIHSDLSWDWEGGEFVIHAGTNSAEVKSAVLNWEK